MRLYSEYSFVHVTIRTQCREQFSNMIRAAGFHGYVNRGIAQVHAIIRAIIRGFDNVRTVLRQYPGEAV